MKVGNESMSVISFQTRVKGNLPHFSYIFRKLEPLVIDFKIVVCSITGALIFIELQRGKEGMKFSNHQQDIGSTEVCTNRMMGATKGIGQKYKKGVTEDCFLFDSWFSSKKS